MPYKKSTQVKRSDKMSVGQWVDDSRLVHVRPDGQKIFIHPHDDLGPVHSRFISIHRMKNVGVADLNDPVSVQVTVKKMTRSQDIEHLKAIARLINAHVKSLKSLNEVPVEVEEAVARVLGREKSPDVQLLEDEGAWWTDKKWNQLNDVAVKVP